MSNLHETSAERVFVRNVGLISREEQKKLGRAIVAVAGAGGDGGLLLEELVRMGVGAEGGEIRVADPQTFGIENLNRQAGSNTATVGQNKAVVAARNARLINPTLKVVTFTEGVTPDNLDSFLKGATVVADEMEYTEAGLGVRFAQRARELGIPVLHALNVVFSGQVTTYHPEGPTLEERLGLPVGISPDDPAVSAVGLDRWLAYIPPYVDARTFEKVAAGEMDAPSVAPGVAIAAGVAATQVALNIWGGENNRPSPIYSPHTIVIDPMEIVAKVVTDPQEGFATSFQEMLVRNEAGKVPLTLY